MKAIVITTDELVFIIRNSAFDRNIYYASNGKSYHRNELYFI